MNLSLEEANEKLPRGLSYEFYVNSRTKVTIKCDMCGFHWEIIPRNVTPKTACSRCKALECKKKLKSSTSRFVRERKNISCRETTSSDVISEYSSQNEQKMDEDYDDLESSFETSKSNKEEEKEEDIIEENESGGSVRSENKYCSNGHLLDVDSFSYSRGNCLTCRKEEIIYEEFRDMLKVNKVTFISKFKNDNNLYKCICDICGRNLNINTDILNNGMICYYCENVQPLFNIERCEYFASKYKNLLSMICTSTPIKIDIDNEFRIISYIWTCLKEKHNTVFTLSLIKENFKKYGSDNWCPKCREKEDDVPEANHPLYELIEINPKEQKTKQIIDKLTVINTENKSLKVKIKKTPKLSNSSKSTKLIY